MERTISISKSGSAHVIDQMNAYEKAQAYEGMTQAMALANWTLASVARARKTLAAVGRNVGIR